MRTLFLMAVVSLAATIVSPQSNAQELFQPAPSHDVVVSSNVGPTGTGLDFDWADVPNASTYELAIRRGAMMIDNIVTLDSHGLYTSVSNPLIPGNPGFPNQYSWQVVTYQNGQVIEISAENGFGLVRGTSVVYPATGVAPPPTNLQPDVRDLFTANLIPEGLFMTWDSVTQAVGYEVQLVQIADANGQPTNRLIYRQNVARNMALVSNIVTGGYRLDVRAIVSGGGRGIPASTSFRIVPNYFDRNIDFVVDGKDMLALATDWYRICRNLDSDFIRDRIVDGREVQAMKIVLENQNADFPTPREVPAPLPPLEAAELVEPVTNEPIILNASTEEVLFDWDPVPDVEEWELTIRNVDLETFQDRDIFDPNQTEVTIPAQTFLVPLGGTGNYTWSVIAKGQCFADQETVRRPFTVQVNFTLPKEEEEKAAEVESADPIESATEDSKPQKVGWLRKVGQFFLGSPAAAGGFPKGATDTVPVPKVIFPFEDQCVSLGPPFDVVWEEVPDAESYLVELRGKTRFGLIVYISIAGADFDSDTKINTFVDPTLGDGIVQSKTQPTLEAVYTLRVAAIVNGETGEFSPKRVFNLSPSCPIPPDFEYIDIDFNDDRTFDGKDVFAYAASWYSATTEEKVDNRLDLNPDGFIDILDMLSYRYLFRNRVILPKSPPLDPPILSAPPEGAQIRFAQTQSNGGVFFSWIPPATTEEAIPYIYEVQINRPPNSPLRVFALLREFTQFPLTESGLYRWRVRAIADDFTLGQWSNFNSFQGIQRTVEGETPSLVSPEDGVVLPAGLVELQWTNIEIVWPDACRFDRLEFYNGDVFSASFDVYHKASMVSSPTVSVTLPLYPNFSEDFRWRVTTYFEFTDSKADIFQIPGLTSGIRTFRIVGDPEVVSGLGQWHGDNTRNGVIDFRDYGRLELGFQTRPDTSKNFDPGLDMNYNGRVDHEDIAFTNGMKRGVRRALNNGVPAPFAAFPAGLPGGKPILIDGTQAGKGVTLSWTSVGSNRYFVEWLDSGYNYRGFYAKRLMSPVRLSPTADQEIVFGSFDETMTFGWSSIPDTQEYSLLVQTYDPDTLIARAGRLITVAPAPLGSATTSYVLRAGDLYHSIPPPDNGQYRYTVIPEACGHFVDSFQFTYFTVQYPQDQEPGSFEISNSKGLNLPTLFTPSIRIPATQEGLHFWRATPMGDDLSFGTPTRWQTFGIEDLGPAYE